MADETDHDDQPWQTVSRAGIILLAGIFGMFTAHFETFPYAGSVERSFEAFEALKEKLVVEWTPKIAPKWAGTPPEERGVVSSDAEQAQPGYTFYASSHAPTAKLVDFDGDVVHEWSKPFSEVWEDPPHVDDPVPDSNVHWGRVRLLDDGSVLGQYVGLGDSPWGYGLVKVDQNSEVVWKYAERVHHDIDVTDTGAIYTLTHSLRDTEREPVAGAPQLEKESLEDFVVELSPDGEERRRISVLEALANSKFAAALQRFPYSIRDKRERKWDPMHNNTVHVVDEDFAEHHARMDAGDILLSMRHLDLVAVLAPDDRTIVWATRGYWTQQHDPDPLPNGDVMVFDNRGHGGPGGRSRILQIDPATQTIEWSYTGTRDSPFLSRKRGSQQLLPNGNVLVTSSGAARIFEVTREGDVVWDYYNPVLTESDGRKLMPQIYGARRVDPDSLEFLDGKE